MTDLTEQWQKGELPEGEYYVKSDWSDGVDIRHIHNGTDNWKEIVAKVPSYKEWQASYNCMLENEVLRLKNAQLKELLKECRECVDENLEFSQSIGRNRIQPRNKGLLKRIDEVLK